MKLYYVIAVTARTHGDKMADLFREAGLTLSLSMLAQGTASSETLARYGLDATEKTVLGGVCGPDAARQLWRMARSRMNIDIPGNGILMTIPIKSVAGLKSLSYLAGTSPKGGVPSMDFEHELIIAVMNEGYSDLLMDAARSAGAGGGTVLHAKGTAGKKERGFLGVRFAPEKDVVYIVAHRDDKTAIMKAILEKAGPGTKAGAVCFSLPISSVVGLRSRDVQGPAD